MEKEKIRTILDLTPDELIHVINTNQFPGGLSWEGLEERDDFAILFRHRGSPAKIAKRLLQSTPGGKETLQLTKGPKEIKYIPSVPLEYKLKKIELKEKELNLQEKKQKNLTLMWEKIGDIDSKVSSIQKDMTQALKVLMGLITFLRGGQGKTNGTRKANKES